MQTIPLFAPLTAKLLASHSFLAKGTFSALFVDCLVSRICVNGVKRFVMYTGVILFKHLKTRVAFLYLTLSENGTSLV